VITLDGSTQRQFTFPGDLQAATDYYRDFDTILGLLPHITLVHKYAPNQYRALYHTTELGVYRVKIYCDLQVRYNAVTRTLEVNPLPGRPLIKQSVTVQALTAQGLFSSRSIFQADGSHTRIDYALQIGARLPKPFGLGLIPDGVMSHIANSIAEWRIHEIAEGFIAKSIEAYRTAKPARPELCPVVLPRPVARVARDRQTA